MSEITDWEEWGAAPACGKAVNFQEGVGVPRDYADEVPSTRPDISVDQWYTQNGIKHAACSLNVPTQTLKAPPVGNFFGNDSSLLSRGQSCVWMIMTGPMGHDGYQPYLNVEIGDVATQKFFVVNVANGAGAVPATTMTISTLPETAPYHDTTILVVPTFRYFIALHVSYCDDDTSYRVPGFRIEYNIQAFSITGAPIASWSEVTFLDGGEGQGSFLGVDGGHVPAVGWWNTNIALNNNPTPDEAQHIKAYAMFWGGRRKIIHDLQAAANYLGPKWAVGDMAIWRPWITMDPSADDWPKGANIIRRRRR